MISISNKNEERYYTFTIIILNNDDNVDFR
jgi:hypothetical protein